MTRQNGNCNTTEVKEAMKRTRTKLTQAEIERRREAVAHATANARLEGQFSSAESEALFNAFVQGEIEFDELLAKLKARHAAS